MLHGSCGPFFVRPPDSLNSRAVVPVVSPAPSKERLRALFSRSQPAPSPQQPRVLVVVEGPFDIEFLRRISTILAAGLADVPDLADLESRRVLVFLPFGGDAWLWTERLAPLGFFESHKGG